MLGSLLSQRGRRVGPSPIQLNRGSQFARGLVGWWPVGNQACWGTDTLLDMSLYDNDGTVVSVPAEKWSIADGRSCITLDGVSDYVDIADSPSMDVSGNAITLMGWHNTTTIDDYDLLIGKEVNGNPYQIWALFVGSASGTKHQKIVFAISTSATRTLFDFDTGIDLRNNLHHYCGVYDGANMLIYLDGALQGSTAKTGNIDTNNNKVRIAKSEFYAGERLQGPVDDVRIYNRALSAGEVAQLYNETKDGSYGSLALPTGPRIWAVDTTAAAASGVVTSLIGEGGMIGYGGMISRGGGMIR